MDSNQIVTEETPHDNFTMIPNLVEELGLDTYAFRLYFHLRRVTGESGACWRSTRTLADECGMSMGKVSESKKVLIEQGLIRIEDRSGEGGIYHHITLVDIWQRNHDYFKSVHHVNTNLESVHQVNAERSPGERNKIPCNKIPHDEEEKEGANAPALPFDSDLDFPEAQSQLRSKEEALASLQKTHDDMVAAMQAGALGQDWQAAARGWGDRLADVRLYKERHALEKSLPLALYLCTRLEEYGVCLDWEYKRAGGQACYWLQEAQRVARVLGNDKSRADALLEDAFSRRINGSLMTVKGPQSLVGIAGDFTRAAVAVDTAAVQAKQAAVEAAMRRNNASW